MNRVLNIRTKASIDDLRFYKNKRITGVDVRFQNTKAKKINTYLPFEIFKKNDLFANADIAKRDSQDVLYFKIQT